MLIAWGDIPQLVQELVQSTATNLVIVGSSVRSVLLNAFIGSIAKRIVARLPCNALMVRGHRARNSALGIRCYNGYALVLVIIWFSDEEFLSIAIDAGGVATGPMANTFLLALALGISSSLGGQDPLIHGLGLVALIALAPIISVMVLGFAVAIKKRQAREGKTDKSASASQNPFTGGKRATLAQEDGASAGRGADCNATGATPATAPLNRGAVKKGNKE